MGTRVPATGLTDYGIQTEESDYRVHVSFTAKAVYVYPTKCGVAAIKSGLYREINAWQPGYNFPTAKGCLVPPTHIEQCREIAIPPDILREVDCRQDDSTPVKGQKAVRVVGAMLVRGLIPINTIPSAIGDKDLQIRGFV
jgi:hypothetical protein